MLNPFKLLAIYRDLNKVEAVTKENATMKVKIPQLLTLFCSLALTIGLPTLATNFVHTHPDFYQGIVAAALVLHSLLPSVFGAPSATDLQATGLNKLGMLLLVVLLAPCMYAQTATQVGQALTPVTSIENFYAAGASYSVNASPGVAGTGLYAHLVAGSGTYAFTVVDALPNTIRPFTVTTNIGAGIAQRVTSVGKVGIYIPTAAGISWNGTNTGWQWNGGAAAMFPLKNGYYLMPTVRFLKSSVSGGTGYQPIVGLLFGWGK